MSIIVSRLKIISPERNQTRYIFLKLNNKDPKYYNEHIFGIHLLRLYDKEDNNRACTASVPCLHECDTDRLLY